MQRYGYGGMSSGNPRYPGPRQMGFPQHQRPPFPPSIPSNNYNYLQNIQFNPNTSRQPSNMYRMAQPMYVHQHRLEDYQPYHADISFNEADFATNPWDTQNESFIQEIFDGNYSQQEGMNNSYTNRRSAPYVTQPPVYRQNEYSRQNQSSQKVPQASRQRQPAIQKRANPYPSSSQPQRSQNPGATLKARRVNPTMPMLPPPKPELKKRPEQPVYRQQPVAKKDPPVPLEPKLYNARFLSGSIPQILKWNAARHKTPPLYETIGFVMENSDLVEHQHHQMENYFSLRNLPEWERVDDFSRAAVLNCVYYSTDRSSSVFSMESLCRVVGRFLPSGIFHCLKVRQAGESDISFVSSKIKGVAGSSNFAPIPSSSERGQPPNSDDSFLSFQYSYAMSSF